MTISFEQRIKQKTLAWIAVFAILCHALMPSIAHMRDAAASIDETDFCPFHLAGMVHHPAKSGQSPLEKFNAPRCGFCVSGIVFAPPPSFLALLRAPEIFLVAACLSSITVLASCRVISPPLRGPPSSLA